MDFIVKIEENEASVFLTVTICCSMDEYFAIFLDQVKQPNLVGVN